MTNQRNPQYPRGVTRNNVYSLGLGKYFKKPCTLAQVVGTSQTVETPEVWRSVVSPCFSRLPGRSAGPRKLAAPAHFFDTACYHDNQRSPQIEKTLESYRAAVATRVAQGRPPPSAPAVARQLFNGKNPCSWGPRARCHVRRRLSSVTITISRGWTTSIHA